MRRSTGRPSGSATSSGTRAPAIAVHPRERPAVAEERPRLAGRRPHERRAGVGRAARDGGEDATLGERQPVAGRRVLPAQPVERLAEEPQLRRPLGGDGAQPGRRRRPERRPRAHRQVERRRGQPRAGVGPRQLAQLLRRQLAEAAEPRDAGVLADADQRHAPRRDAELRQPGEDLDDLELVVQVRLEPQDVLAVAVVLQRAVALDEHGRALVTVVGARPEEERRHGSRAARPAPTSGTGPSCSTSRQ